MGRISGGRSVTDLAFSGHVNIAGSWKDIRI